MTPQHLLPEQQARERIDALLVECGWSIQDYSAINLGAARGVAVREYPLRKGHGKADYLLYVDGLAVGAVEAKKEGETLTGVEIQTAKYSTGLPDGVPAAFKPLPFLYESTGTETQFTNRLDPEPRSREVFAFHRPETMAGWLEEGPLWMPVVGGRPHPASLIPATFRRRLTVMPVVLEKGLWPAQLTAVRNLETSLAKARQRSLIQMATGSGKTYTAVTSVYRVSARSS